LKRNIQTSVKCDRIHQTSAPRNRGLACSRLRTCKSKHQQNCATKVCTQRPFSSAIQILVQPSENWTQWWRWAGASHVTTTSVSLTYFSACPVFKILWTVTLKSHVRRGFSISRHHCWIDKCIADVFFLFDFSSWQLLRADWLAGVSFKEMNGETNESFG
jgi:hypothetical protein